MSEQKDPEEGAVAAPEQASAEGSSEAGEAEIPKEGVAKQLDPLEPGPDPMMTDDAIEMDSIEIS